MATKKKMLQAAAGNAGGAGLNVEDVFSTYLYTSSGTSSQGELIQNGVDLTEDGSLIWTKSRGDSRDNYLVSRTSSSSSVLSLISNSASSGSLGSYFAYQSNGYNLPTFPDSATGTAITTNGEDYVSWTFRKAPKFFDVVTYTGDGTGLRNIPHDLGVTPGFVIIKRTDASGDWGCGVLVDGVDQYEILKLNTTDISKTQFGVGSATTFNVAVGSYNFDAGTDSNISGAQYVAYLFAHNDGDGEFGGEADADIIKCGSYTGTGAAGNEIDLGFEPQWLLVKNANEISNWNIYDVMRGMTVGGTDYQLEPNTSDAELGYSNWFDLTPNGFTVQTGAAAINGSGNNVIYIAIRRGTKVPESGTEVFAPVLASATSGFVTDTLIQINRSGASWSPSVGTRLLGSNALQTSSASAETSGGYTWDSMDGISSSISADRVYNYWKRAPGFFDAVAYTGNGTAGRTVSHNLGVAPEMMWVKSRNQTYGGFIYHAGIGEDKALILFNGIYNVNAAATYASWNNTAPNSSVFTLGNFTNVNNSGDDFIAYLFASLDGVSKVGSYTGNGTSQTIDCGFSSGARFILVKRTDSTGDWYVWDTERGIVAGNDPYLELNTTDAEVTSTDWVDPDNSGFIVNGTTINASSAEYIFYAIA